MKLVIYKKNSSVYKVIGQIGKTLILESNTGDTIDVNQSDTEEI